jgi:hypothetical protein
MSADASASFDRSNANDRARLRHAAAGLIKALIRARIRQDQSFLTPEDRERWGVNAAASERRSCKILLQGGKQLRERFEQSFLTHLTSIPDPASASGAEQIDGLIDQVASFIHGDLDSAITEAAQGQQVDWDALCAWDSLPEIRDALDHLPSELRGTSLPDGPRPPAHFRYGGRDLDLTGKPLLLLGFLWSKRNRSAELGDLAEPVWGDAELNADDLRDPARGVQRRLNEFFRENGLPFRISIVRDRAKSRDYVRLIQNADAR